MRNAVESTSTTALHPMAPIASMQPMLPIAQFRSVSRKPKLCLHHRVSRTLSTNVSALASPTNSSAHLMSGALSPAAETISSCPVIIGSSDLRNSSIHQMNTDGNGKPRKFERFIPCWKCMVDRATRFWAQATSCLCFVCCGFERDDESFAHPAYGYGFATGSGYFDNQELEGARRIVLDETPSAMG